VFEAMLAQELQCLQRAPAGLAVDIVGLVGVQFGDSLRQRAERDQPRALQVGNLVFVRLAHVEDLDAEPRVLQRAFQFVNGDFVYVDGGRAPQNVW
jgi:hypothetical protein